MNEKLNALTNLISDLAAQAREGKHKYESESSDSTGKKKARAYVERQNLPQPSTSRNQDDIISIPDASILRRQIQDCCQEGEDKGYTEGENDPIFNSISQEFTVMEEVGSPLKSSKIAGIINNSFIEELDEERLKELVKSYNYPENDNSQM